MALKSQLNEEGMMDGLPVKKTSFWWQFAFSAESVRFMEPKGPMVFISIFDSYFFS